MAEDKAGVQEPSVSPRIKELQRHIDEHNSAQELPQNPGRRKFLAYGSGAAAGVAALVWWDKWWPFRNANQQQKAPETESSEISEREKQIKEFGLVVQNYINPEYQGNFLAGKFNESKIKQLASKSKVLDEGENTIISPLPPGGSAVDMGNLSSEVPRLDRLFASFITTEDGRLAKVVITGNLHDQNIPDDQLSGAAQTFFNLSKFKPAQKSNELFTTESNAAGRDANDMPILDEFQREEQRRTHNGLERAALLALNSKGGFYLEVNVLSDDEMKSNKKQSDPNDLFPNAKG